MSNHIYSPYGAYELKASYHKNLLMGNLYVLSAVLLILTIFFVIQLVAPEKITITKVVDDTIKIIKDIPPPPTIVREQNPHFEPRQPNNRDIPQYTIPVPVEDSLYVEDEIVELVSITDPAIVGNGEGSDDADHPFEIDNPGGIGEGVYEYIPEPETFIPHEQPPEIIHKEMPEYPKFCQQIGIEGVVKLHLYIGINGDVLDVRIAKSSENKSLDEAAEKASYKNKYSPAIQNGNPIALWIGYKVEFKLNR